MVPNGWKTLSLGEITKEKISYGIVQAGPHVENGVPYIKSSNVGGEIKIEDLQRTSSEIHHKYRRSAVHPNDIVFSLRGNIGRTSIVPPELLEANLTQGTARISVNTKNETNFIYYSLASTPILNRINSLSKGSTFKEISLEELRKVKLPIPPLSEQQKIAKILSTWDNAISTTERLIDNSTQQKKALMQQLLTGKKRLLDESGQRFAGEWEEKTLIDAGMTVTDGDRGKEYPNSSEFYDEGDYLFLSAKNVTKKGFLFEDTQFISKEKYEKLGKGIVNRGDVVLTTRGTVGQTAYYDDSVQYEFLRVNSGMVTLGCNNSELESNFFYALTNSSLFTRQVESLTFGSAQPQLTIRIIKSLKVPIPPVPEQQKIATVLTNADKEIELLEQQLADLQQEKKALMQVLLTGKKRVVVDGDNLA